MSPQDTAENAVCSPAVEMAENSQKLAVSAPNTGTCAPPLESGSKSPFPAQNGPETPVQAGSPRLQAGAESVRTEAQARAVRARRARLEADLIEEGASDAMVARLATDETAGRIVAHERRVIDSIAAMFGGVRA